jgi:hypothetical protein
MAVNGIEIEVGQKWRTRSGAVADVFSHDPSDDRWTWELSIAQGDGQTGWDWCSSDGVAGINSKRGNDLVELISQPASGDDHQAVTFHALPVVDVPQLDQVEERRFSHAMAGAGDIKATNPKDAIGSSKLPMHLVPDTLMIFAAMGFAEGDSKYVGYNFRIAGVRATVYIAALRRHFMRYVNGEWADKKTGVPHLASVVACAGILIDGHVVGNIIDDRPPGVDLSESIEEAERIIAHVYKMNSAIRAAAPVQQYTAERTATTLPVSRPHETAQVTA